MPYLAMLLLGLELFAGLFWLLQIIRVLTTDAKSFEDHKHKLLWFLVVVFVPVVGAIWFVVWRHQTSVKRAQRSAERNAEENVRSIAEAYRAEKKV